MIKASIAETQGTPISTRSAHDGIGFGYLMDGEVYVSMGNGFYATGPGPFPPTMYRDDSGAAYRQAVRFDRSILSLSWTAVQ